VAPHPPQDPHRARARTRPALVNGHRRIWYKE
jgi:hypothetical protein